MDILSLIKVKRFLPFVLFLGSLTTCKNNDLQLAHEQVQLARQLYQNSQVEEGDRVIKEFLQQYTWDLFYTSQAVELAVEFNRESLTERAQTQLLSSAKQLAATEILLRLLFLQDFNAIEDYLLSSGAEELPTLVRDYFELVLACELNEESECREHLQATSLPPIQEPTFRQLGYARRIRELWILGEREKAAELLKGAIKESPDSQELRGFDRVLQNLDVTHVRQRRIRRREQFELVNDTTSSDTNTETCDGQSKFSGVEVWGAYPICPPSAAVIATLRSDMLYAHCCALEHSDLITEEKVYRESLCPEDYVVTASLPRCSPAEQMRRRILQHHQSCQTLLVCSKVNTDKYKLSPPTRGIHWGEGSTFWLERKSVPKSKIPLGIRSAVGRVSKYYWDSQGCIGFPFGAMLVGREGKECHQEYYSEFLPRSSSAKEVNLGSVLTGSECEPMSTPQSPPRCEQSNGK